MYRYQLDLSLPVAALFRGLDGLNATITSTLIGMGVKANASENVAVEVPLRITTTRKLDSGERSKVIAAVEQQYASVGAAITDFTFLGEDDTTPEVAPITAALGAQAAQTGSAPIEAPTHHPTEVAPLPNNGGKPELTAEEAAKIEFEAGAQLARDGKELPDGASNAALDGYISVNPSGDTKSNSEPPAA